MERIAKVASELPQWLLLRLPIHLVLVKRLDATEVKSASSTGAPPKMWERAPFVSPDQGNKAEISDPLKQIQKWDGK